MSLPQNPHPGKTEGVTHGQLAAAARCSVITGLGRSAVAVVAVTGHDAIQVVSKCFRGASSGELAPGQVRYGTWGGSGETSVAGESVVVTPLADDSIEIHCHGGPAATARIVADLRACGVTPLQHGQWKWNDRSLLIREASEVLACCVTPRTAAIAMDQVRGAMLNWASSGLQTLVRGTVSANVIRHQAAGILQHAPLGLRLTDPFRIVLVGPPNVGKSSLLNAIVGYERSITFDGAGTTRDVLHAETVIDGWPVRLSDTAGIRESSEPVEQEGVVRARSAADRADLLLSVTEPALVNPTIVGSPLPDQAAFSSVVPMIRLLNKSDLRPSAPNTANLPITDSERIAIHPPGFDLLTSVLTGEGMEALMEMISRRLAQVIPEPGAPVPITERQSKSLLRIAESLTVEQLRDALNSLLGFDAYSEEP